MGEGIGATAEVAAGRASPVRRERPSRRGLTRADTVYEGLYEAIENLSLVPGTPLQEKTLTERFAVSRTPVREALIRLAEDGLVDVFPQSGTFVSRIPVEAIPEAALIRQALEDMAVQRTAGRATPAELARLDVLLTEQRLMAELGDTDAFHAADEGFHEAIVVIARLPSLNRLLRQVKVQINRARRLTLPAEGRMEQVVAEHQAIRDAIRAHDGRAARAAMKAHLSVVLPDVDRLRGQYPDYFV
jgi:DNA-binding GntR family transcriptional regulator